MAPAGAATSVRKGEEGETQVGAGGTLPLALALLKLVGYK